MPPQTHSEKKKREEMCKQLCKKTKFNRNEVMWMVNMYKQKIAEVGRENRKMDRTTFRNILHEYFGITDDILMDRVFKAFDLDNDQFLSVDEWVKGLSTYMRGTVDQLCKFCFDVYDMNNDGNLSREEMTHLLKNCFPRRSADDEEEENLKELVDTAFKQLSPSEKESRGHLTYEEFKTGMGNADTPEMYIEMLGQVLPSRQHKEDFLYELEVYYSGREVSEEQEKRAHPGGHSEPAKRPSKNSKNPSNKNKAKTKT